MRSSVQWLRSPRGHLVARGHPVRDARGRVSVSGVGGRRAEATAQASEDGERRQAPALEDPDEEPYVFSNSELERMFLTSNFFSNFCSYFF